MHNNNNNMYNMYMHMCHMYMYNMYTYTLLAVARMQGGADIRDFFWLLRLLQNAGTPRIQLQGAADTPLSPWACDMLLPIRRLLWGGCTKLN